MVWVAAAGVDGGGGGGAGQAWIVSAFLFFIFFEKKFAECFFGTRQRFCRVRDKKHSAN